MAILPGWMNKVLNILLILFLLSVPLSLFSEPNSRDVDINQWFLKNAEANIYLPYKTAIETLFNQVKNEKLPEWILFEKLKEGASKKIKGEALVSGLEKGFHYLILIREIFDNLGILVEDKSIYEETMKSLAIFLLGGLPEELLKEILMLSLQKEMKINEQLLLCEALLKIKVTSSLENVQLSQLTVSLLNSIIPPTGYLTVSSLFRKGKIGYIQEETLFKLIIEVLDRGGGLVQLNNELNRRIKKR